MGPGWRAPSAALVGGSVALFGALRRAALALPRPAAVRSRPGRVWRWRNLLVSFAHSVLAGLWALFRYRGWMGARGVMPWAAQAQLSHSPGGRNTALFPLPPPVHRGGIGVLGLYPRSSAQPHPASLPAAFGSPRSCSLTSRTGTASQGICWSASPQVSAHPPPPGTALPAGTPSPFFSPFSLPLFSYIAGYFIHDSLDIIFNQQSRSSWEYLVHHAMVSAAVGEVTCHSRAQPAGSPAHASPCLPGGLCRQQAGWLPVPGDSQAARAELPQHHRSWGKQLVGSAWVL